jgi:hypothetical protein
MFGSPSDTVMSSPAVGIGVDVGVGVAVGVEVGVDVGVGVAVGVEVGVAVGKADSSRISVPSPNRMRVPSGEKAVELIAAIWVNVYEARGLPFEALTTRTRLS